jgi:8-oxo-dGTP pyrophosphatase MutT (NUDIX family)
LRSWEPRDSAQRALRDEYLTFLDAHGSDAFDRDAGRSHITASCFVFNADLSAILLCFHRKGQFWVQLGGHIEPADRSVADAATREAAEEAGVDVTLLGDWPADIDRHALGSGFSRCDVHWDVGFAAIADRHTTLTVTDESEAVQWWPVNDLPTGVPEGFPNRVARILASTER